MQEEQEISSSKGMTSVMPARGTCAEQSQQHAYHNRTTSYRRAIFGYVSRGGTLGKVFYKTVVSRSRENGKTNFISEVWSSTSCLTEVVVWIHEVCSSRNIDKLKSSQTSR